MTDHQVPNRDEQHGGLAEVGRCAQLIKAVMREAPNWKRGPLDSIEREGLDMIAHKIARILCGADPYDPEHWTDIAGYAEAAMRARREQQEVVE